MKVKKLGPKLHELLLLRQGAERCLCLHGKVITAPCPWYQDLFCVLLMFSMWLFDQIMLLPEHVSQCVKNSSDNVEDKVNF